ncbi:MAG: hypothetical protein GYA57_20545, partial [Myxococcales bacterium]|nr:hypothetical protein [Myxococcales bacterium]
MRWRLPSAEISTISSGGGNRVSPSPDGNPVPNTVHSPAGSPASVFGLTQIDPPRNATNHRRLNDVVFDRKITRSGRSPLLEPLETHGRTLAPVPLSVAARVAVGLHLHGGSLFGVAVGRHDVLRP